MSKSTSAHSLIELSSRQWSRLKSHSMCLTEMTAQPGKNKNVGYNNIQLGTNMVIRKRKGKSAGRNMQWKTPLLSNIKGGYMLIVAEKIELVKSNPDLIVIDGCNQGLLLDNVNDHTNYQPSGIVVLCIAKLEQESIKFQYL